MTGNGKVAVGYCYGQSTMTPQWARSYRMVLHRDAATKRRIVGEFAHEASGVHVPTARCHIVRDFLAHPARPEWLWIVDTDATFADDILERLVAVAHPTDRPIVGALAFGVRPVKDAAGREMFNGVGAAPLELFPTLYLYDEANTLQMWAYPPDQVVQVHATGAHCLLVHRSVLADPRWTEDGHPLPWFRTTVFRGAEMSEDQFFCLKAGAMGYPVHVDTAAKTGHVKTFVADEDHYGRQQAALMPRVPPATECVDVIVPVLHRPQNVRPLMRSLTASTGLAEALFVVEPGDTVEADEAEACGARVLYYEGSFARKVNAAYERTVGNGRAPWLLLVGDDVVFHPGWLDHALAVAEASGADVVGVNDHTDNPRTLRREHAGHLLIRRSYVEELGASWDGPGIVCHEGYRHWFVDDEIVTVAKQRGTFDVAVHARVEHMHHLFGKAPVDDVYRLGQSHMAADKALFEKRLRRFGRAS